LRTKHSANYDIPVAPVDSKNSYEGREMEDKVTFVTSDSTLTKGKRGMISKTDQEILQSVKTGKGMVTLSANDLKKMAKAASDRFDEFKQMVKPMTKKQAEVVRKLRVEEGYSWRAVAQVCYDLGFGKWQPPSNQIAGMALCERAAEIFNEDYMKEPWN
jgi:hypothetical protein